MFEIVQVPGPFETYVLRDTAAGSAIDVVPARGAIVTRFAVGRREVLYLDPATLADPSKNVRGGIPVLFPIAGRLTDDRYRDGDASYALKQHGFARTLPWTVLERARDEAARLTLGLESSEATREHFPWEFEVRLSYVLAGTTLAIEQEYTNRSARPMPLHVGFHPYFLVPDARKSGVRIAADATRAFDNTRKTEVAFEGFDLTRPEVDLHLLDPHARETRVELGDGNALVLERDSSFATLVVWTLAGRDFVCVEPWSAPADALNTRAGLIYVPPGATRRARCAITAI